MAEVEVRDLKNKVVGKLELADEVFNYSASPTLLWEAVRAFEAKRRKGTHAAKNRSDVRGGGQKPWRQKGTGRARVGSLRSPIWRKGGVVFGPRPRDYSQALPKKKRRGAVKMVLTDKLKNGRLVVVEDFQLESFKTREFAGVLKTLELQGKVLVVEGGENRNLYLGSRNLPGVKLASGLGVNVHDLMRHDHLLFSKEAVLALQEVLRK